MRSAKAPLDCRSEAKRNVRVLAVGKTQPYTLRFSPKSVIPLERREEREHCFSNAQRGIPLSLLTPVPRWGVGGTRKTT